MNIHDHAEAARRRWGGTPQWQQVTERTAHYTAADWQAFREEISVTHLKVLPNVYRWLAQSAAAGLWVS